MKIDTICLKNLFSFVLKFSAAQLSYENKTRHHLMRLFRYIFVALPLTNCYLVFRMANLECEKPEEIKRSFETTHIFYKYTIVYIQKFSIKNLNQVIVPFFQKYTLRL